MYKRVCDKHDATAYARFKKWLVNRALVNRDLVNRALVNRALVSAMTCFTSTPLRTPASRSHLLLTTAIYLYMCPHEYSIYYSYMCPYAVLNTAIYLFSCCTYYSYICPHAVLAAAIYVSLCCTYYCYMCVLILHLLLLYMCPHSIYIYITAYSDAN